MQDFLEFVVSGLVKHPESVSVTPVEKGDLTLFELRMDPADVGKIIGRKGMTINAIRSLAQVAANNRGVRCSVEIIEDGPPRA